MTNPAFAPLVGVAASAPSTLSRAQYYAFAAACMLASLALLALLAPNPAAPGLRPVAPDRIQLMEPGEQHQARHPSSAQWSLDFADQFRFDSETAIQRAAGGGTRDVSPDERQWHLNLTQAESSDSAIALFIPNAAGDLTLHINGTSIADGAPLPAYSGAGIGGTSLAAPLTEQALPIGLNRIDILQSADPAHVGIRAIYLGSADAVQMAKTMFARWIDWQRFAAAISAAIGLAGPIMLFLAWQQRIAAAAFVALAMVQLVDLFAPAGQQAWLSPAKACITLAASAVLIILRRRDGRWSDAVVLGLAITSLLAGLAALLLSSNSGLLPLPFQWLQLANNGARSLLLVGIPISLWRDRISMFQRLRDARAEMNRKDAIIADQKQALDNEVRHAAILEERQRFARDMHDGIGGHLQALLMRVRADRINTTDIASELQSGLTDLRLMVDSLDQIDSDLYAALENFRMRVSPQLAAAEIGLGWDLSDSVRDLRLEPRAILSIFRILQEIVTNCVRHSGSSNLAVSIAHDHIAGLLVISAADDGAGFDPHTARAGKGLRNMRQRAEKLRGTFNAESSADRGTKIDIQVPTQAATLKL